MAPIRRRRAVTALGPGLIGLVLLTACSTSPAPSAAPPTVTPPSASSVAATPTTPAGDTVAACAALPQFDAAVVGYPGAEPGAPPPPAGALTQWAATATGPLEALAGSAPGELAAPLATLRSAIAGAAQGTPIDVQDERATAALNTVDNWGYDTCGFRRLDVSGTGTELPGVPSAYPAGPLAVRFDNGGEPDKRGFVLLVARVHDGGEYSLDGIRNGSVDFTSVADVVAAAQPPTGQPTGYSVALLTPGRYLVVSPIGAPPQFSSTVAAEFVVD